MQTCCITMPADTLYASGWYNKPKALLAEEATLQQRVLPRCLSHLFLYKHKKLGNILQVRAQQYHSSERQFKPGSQTSQVPWWNGQYNSLEQAEISNAEQLRRTH